MLCVHDPSSLLFEINTKNKRSIFRWVTIELPLNLLSGTFSLFPCSLAGSSHPLLHQPRALPCNRHLPTQRLSQLSDLFIFHFLSRSAEGDLGSGEFSVQMKILGNDSRNNIYVAKTKRKVSLFHLDSIIFTGFYFASKENQRNHLLSDTMKKWKEEGEKEEKRRGESRREARESM